MRASALLIYRKENLNFVRSRMSRSITELIEQEFPGKRIVVIGDAVADQYLSGTISRISREAPVFIVDHDRTETLPGGAANAAANLAALGADPIMIGVVGNDAAGEELRRSLEALNVATEMLVVAPSRRTTAKLRVLAGQQYAPRQQVIRIDTAASEPLEEEITDRLIERLTRVADTAAGIIVSDYNYGVVSPQVFESAKSLAAEAGIPLIVDSRFGIRKFPGATAATPNREEAEAAIGTAATGDACEALRAELGHDTLLVTLGSEGMLLCEKEKAPEHLPAVGSRQPIDVTGAGDTVIAAYTLALASGMSHRQAAEAANHAGGLVVMKRGTAVVSLEELRRSFSGPAMETATAATD